MTRTARRTYRRPRRIRHRLRRLHWGWWTAATVLAVSAFKEWTAQIITALAVTAAASIAIAALYGRQNLQARLRTPRLGQVTRWIPRPRTAQHVTIDDYYALEPDDFEHAIAALARRDPAVRTATPQGGSDDRGLDVLVRLHDGRRILIQCKRYGPRNRVTSEDVQKTNGTYRDIHHCQLGVIVTTSGYTRSALQTNAMLRQPLVLVDGPGLAAWARGGPTPWA